VSGALFGVSFPDPDNGTIVGVLGAILRTANRCPQAVAFWKSNPALWPVDSLILGSQSYKKSELKQILAASGNKTDASLPLASQLVAAKFNLAHGSNPTPVSSTIDDADALLSRFPGKLPYNVNPSSRPGRAMVRDATMLSDYNRGDLTPDCTP